jgi:hypothetical protein
MYSSLRCRTRVNDFDNVSGPLCSHDSRGTIRHERHTKLIRAPDPVPLHSKERKLLLLEDAAIRHAALSQSR